MRTLQAVVVRRQDEILFQEPVRLGLVRLEQAEVHRWIRRVEVEPGELDLALVVDLPVRDPRRPLDVVDRLLVLQIHGDALEPVGELGRHRFQVETTGLLEVGELRDLHSVEPHLPAEAPGAERRGFPIVFDEAHVVPGEIETERAQAIEIEFLDVRRRRFQDDLELVMALETVRVLAIAAIRRPA